MSTSCNNISPADFKIDTGNEMLVEFVKMHGLGNDFIVIDDRGDSLPGIAQKAARLCHRRLGIGADQLLLLKSSRKADFRMQIFNADGSQVQMCGNGIRCLARYIKEQGLSDKNTLSIETLAGIIKPRLIGELVQVDMGSPVLDGERIPVAASGMVIRRSLSTGDRNFQVTCVSMGNPHGVIFVEDVDGFAVDKYGALLEKHPFFPQRANIEFIEVLDSGTLKMRVWERGAGETPACGTGACAALVAAVLNRKSKRRVTVKLPGGELDIHWQEEDNHVYMCGPAVTVFHGRIKF